MEGCQTPCHAACCKWTPQAQNLIKWVRCQGSDSARTTSMSHEQLSSDRSIPAVLQEELSGLSMGCSLSLSTKTVLTV